MKHWKKLSQAQIKDRIQVALENNIDYNSTAALGIPASYLDPKVFNQDASFLRDAPFITTMVRNPNHIGCHTLGDSESYFAGTQEIERELIDICAIDIFNSTEGHHDGYVASGGTEANMQAIWIYRNYYLQKNNAEHKDICIICSEDSHYSMDKAANVLSIDIYKVPIVDPTRIPNKHSILQKLSEAQQDGKKYFIVICNMMTTMFGSVDQPEHYIEALNENNLEFKMHVDGAYGGFYYPFANEENSLNFANSNISSITIDAHKMAQAPYGTGLFLIRKGYMQYAKTQEASYVKGEDSTLIGSRSGANAIAVWMILSKNGPYEWHEKVFILQKRTQWLCKQLQLIGASYYRNEHSNIVTIAASDISQETVNTYGLVPDDHHSPKWYKVVIMDHVTIEKLSDLIETMKQEVLEKNLG